MKDSECPMGVRLIQLPLNVDERGQLSFAEGCGQIPFENKRVFWISGVPAGQTRGGHAHWTCHEVVFPVTGSFEIEVDDGTVARTFTMNDSATGVLIPAGAWCELRKFAPGTVCVVVASEAYSPEGYEHSQSEWREKVSSFRFQD